MPNAASIDLTQACHVQFPEVSFQGWSLTKMVNTKLLPFPASLIWGFGAAKLAKHISLVFFKNLRSFQLSGHQDPMIPLPLWAASILGDLQGVRQHLDIYGLG